MVRNAFFVGTAVGPAILLAAIAIGQLRDPFPPASFFTVPLQTSLQTGLLTARTLAGLELCLAAMLIVMLGRSPLPARLGALGLLPLVLMLSRAAQRPP